MTAKDVLAIVDKLVTNPDGTIEPADAFLVAEQICAAAYDPRADLDDVDLADRWIVDRLRSRRRR